MTQTWVAELPTHPVLQQGPNVATVHIWDLLATEMPLSDTLLMLYTLVKFEKVVSSILQQEAAAPVVETWA